MSTDYTVSTPLRIEETSGTASILMTVQGSATNNLTITSTQTTGDVVLTLGDPTAGQVVRASSTTAGAWANPLEVQEEGSSLNVANFHTLNFVGSNITAADAGSGVASVSLAIDRSMYDRRATAGTDGGTVTTDAWTTMPFTDSVREDSVTRTGNTFSLPAGTYSVRAESVFQRSQDTRLRWRNTTDSTTAINSLSFTFDVSNHSSSCTLYGSFTIAGTKVFELQYYATSDSGGGAGLGAATGISGTAEIYTSLEIIKDS